MDRQAKLFGPGAAGQNRPMNFRKCSQWAEMLKKTLDFDKISGLMSAFLYIHFEVLHTQNLMFSS